MADQLPIDYPITVAVGRSFADTFYITDDNGDSALIAGCTAALTVRSALDGTELLSLTTLNNKLVVDVDAGTVTPDTLPADTLDIAGVPAVYELVVTWPSGKAFTYFAGKAFIRLGAT